MKHIHHAIDYIELFSVDLDSARTFYEDVFGWQFTEYGPDYLGIKSPLGKGEIGGIAGGRKPTHGGPLVLLFSEDLDATETNIVANGGNITKAPYEFPGGRRLHFRDPCGNELGVWSER
ncbi:VOC family protein [Gulosibacter molinativorax]|uniref:VOC family protein n=1 Tax=Gulosibacter molinativorax TaxID=256821 RepID=A0ABT7C567_9MICO|nr:VOC family protein [Gulosibacter molinativorax]MDJ1370343.1 VOC family protein [Gulosibacter molinativorax]QUY61256.1 Glyoxalase/bleomycin resistance protein/dioxygenase [Gulosibacter molinativorax]